MSEIKVLWVDDEIDLLKPHIIFLENRNYKVTTAQSGSEALEEIHKDDFDIIFLDENMPGISGLETLNEIKITLGLFHKRQHLTINRSLGKFPWICLW